MANDTERLGAELVSFLVDRLLGFNRAPPIVHFPLRLYEIRRMAAASSRAVRMVEHFVYVCYVLIQSMSNVLRFGFYRTQWRMQKRSSNSVLTWTGKINS